MFWIWWTIGIAALLTAVLLYCVAPGKMSYEAKKAAEAFFGINIAHRGLHTENTEIPENSMAAFALASEKGYGVELDVRLTKDEQVVVFHDDNLGRVCGLDQLVKDLTYSELLNLRL